MSAKVSAIAIPTAASSPSVSPCAVVTADAVSSASASTAPVSGITAPVPIVARAEMLEMVTATAGATATSSLFAPVFASTTSACTAFARIVRSAPSETTAVSAIEASALSLTTAIAIDAPIPTLFGVVGVATVAGSAFTVELDTDSALTLTSSVVALSSLASASSEDPPASSAVVRTV